MLYEYGIVERDDRIFSFIGDNQGCKMRDIIVHCENEEISSKKTTIKIISNLIEKELIRKSKSETDARAVNIYLNKDNSLAELRFEIYEIQRSFDLLVEDVVTDNNASRLDTLNIEYSIKVKIISLLSCILKLITSLIHEILISFSGKIKLKRKDYLHEQYRHFQSKISEMLLSFGRLQDRLDKKSLDYIPIFTKRNDTPFKTFLWSIMIYYETRLYPPYFIYTKNFKTTLLSTMKLIYNLGKKYSTSFYDELVCDVSTYNNEFHGFPFSRYTRHMREELIKLDYSKFVRLLIERCLSIESLKSSSAGTLLNEIELKLSKRNPILDPDKHVPGIFENTLDNVVKSLNQK